VDTADEGSAALEEAGDDGQLRAAVEHLLAWDRVQPRPRRRGLRAARRSKR
jgi:hypothetical protein